VQAKLRLSNCQGLGKIEVQESEMSREAAKKIVDLMIKHGAEQNALLAEIQSICSNEEFQKYKRMIAQSMGSILLDVVNPIVEMYPDLKPSQLE
jgi:predicted transcriptional regulator